MDQEGTSANLNVHDAGKEHEAKEQASMAGTAFEEVNALLEDGEAGGALAARLSVLLGDLARGGREAELPRHLSERALAGLREVLPQVRMPGHAREHILWCMYSVKCGRTEGSIGDDLLDRLVADWRTYRFVGLESVAVSCLKGDRLTPAQVEQVEQAFDTRSVRKEAAKYGARRLVAQGGALSLEEVDRLLSMEAFDVLDQALDEGAIARDALPLFEPAARGERNRKHKLRLYEKAQRLASGEGGGGCA